MLEAVPKNVSLTSAHPLSEAEDRLIRNGFGRYASAGGREAARHLIQNLHRTERRLVCDCRIVSRPILVPVAGSHINRHPNGCPEHEEACDFYLPPGQQRRITKSYARPTGAKPLNLLREAGGNGTAARVDGHGYTRGRSRIATMLMRLIEAAGINRIVPGEARLGFAQQMEAVTTVAREIELLHGVPLSDFLVTDVRYLGAFYQNLRRSRSRFDGGPPHGILLCVADGVEDDTIKAHRRNAIPIQGASVAIFGEQPPALRGQRLPLRPPYLAACLVGEREVGGPIQILRAYLHPCWSERDLLLVDSQNERETLKTILSLAQWLANKRQVRFTIEKPLFDIGTAEADEAEADDARMLCIPDFLLHVLAPVADQPPIVIVETMGYDDPVYHERKRRSHALMRAALQGAPLVEDDRTRPNQAASFSRHLIATLLQGIPRDPA